MAELGPVRQAAILVGGMGSRLGALTATTPKPLIAVAGRPFLDHLLFELGRHGFTDIVLLAGFGADAVEAYARTTPMAARFGLTLRVSRETTPAGTGGALMQVRHLLAPRFLLLNGDSWLDANLRALAAAELPAGGMVMAVRALDDASRSGVVAADGAVVTRFAPRPERPGPGLVNAGVYLVDRAALGGLAPVCSLEDDILPTLAAAGRLRCWQSEGYFIDIGVPEALGEAQQALPKRMMRGAVFFDRDGVLNVDHGHVGDVARLEWVPGAPEAVRRVNDRGLFAFVVTNQAGVAKGLYTEADVLRLHRHMSDILAGSGAHIDAFSYCPFHPEGTVSKYAMASARRKPGAGMILELLADWPVDPGRSLLVGDKDSDIAAAHAAGIPGHLFRSGRLDDFLGNLIKP